MNLPHEFGSTTGSAHRALVSKIALVAVATLAVTGCRDVFEPNQRVAGWTIAEPAQRHPILVSEVPKTLSLSVERHGLSPHQKGRLLSFLNRFKAQDRGNSRLTIHAPSGSGNEVSAMRAVHQINALAADYGFDPSTIEVAPYQAHGAHPPIKVAYNVYVAEGPECGKWSANVARSSRNLPYPDFGCANQRNFAEMVANPADLLGPRTQTPRSGEVRDQTWDKFKKGESTVSQRSADERVEVSE